MTPDMKRTVEWIASVQQSDGSIPWWPGGRTDAWNHTEAAMALDAGGRHAEAERAYRWLAATQRPDGAWPAAIRSEEVVDPTLDANFCAYVAAGVWHHALATGDHSFTLEMWPTVETAIDFVLDLQSADGSVYWARDEHYRPWPRALLTSSACICLSIDCALSIAESIGQERPDWELSLEQLVVAVGDRPEAFENKDRYSMDWYYPILSGALRGERAAATLDARWGDYVMEGRGVRCVADRPWVTAAETCELAMALVTSGRPDEASTMWSQIQVLRREDGAYWTGATWPDGTVWPREATTWSAAAVVLAADALDGSSPTAWFFPDACLRLRPASEPVGDAL